MIPSKSDDKFGKSGQNLVLKPLSDTRRTLRHIVKEQATAQ
jgi:hypothetical protein